jgi:methyltransferase (TIGR00027 family)
MRGRASLTAEYMALFRALESSRPESSRLFRDPFAPLFLRSWRRWMNGIARFDIGRQLAEELLDRNAPGARAAGIARTKWIDDEASKALETARQLVLLGAGFDCRAYRLPAARQVVTFELDRSETSLAKQAALRNTLGSLPQQVRFVSIDFNRQSISEVLDQADFDRTRPACFIWEGVTNYLNSDAVDSGLRQIRQSAPGSVLVFTYVHRKVLEEPKSFFGAEKLLARLESYGEPWTFGLYPEELTGYLAAQGLRLICDAGVADIWRRAKRPSSEVRGYEFYRVASASVER